MHHNEKSIKKTIELFKCYEKALYDQLVYESILSVVQRARKLNKATDIKAAAAEFEEKLLFLHRYTLAVTMRVVAC